MRVSEAGVSVWFGTPDAPAPSGAVAAGEDTSVTIGLEPPDPAANVTVLYRINHGPPQTVPAQPKTPESGKQYFHAQLPAFKAGDKVEYVAIYRSGKRQIPSNQEAESHVVTFTAGPPASATTHSTTHSTSSKLSLPKAQLLALYEFSSSTLAQVQAHNKALAAVLLSKIAAQEREMVNAAFAGSSKTLLAALAKIDLTSTARGSTTLRQTLIEGFKKQHLDATTGREALDQMNRLERSGRLVDQSDARTPLSKIPLFQEEFAEAAIFKLTDSVNLNETKGNALVSASKSTELIDDPLLEELVKEKILTAAEATEIGLVLILHRLGNSSVPLALAAKKRVTKFSDIVKLSAADWRQLIESSHAEIPAGIDAAGYANALRSATAKLHPSAALLALFATASKASIEHDISAVAPLEAKNSRLFGIPWEDLDTQGISEHDLAAIKKAHADLTLLANEHPGLALVGTLNSGGKPAEKAATISARLSAAQRLRDLNPNVEFLGMDHSTGSADVKALKTEGISPENLRYALQDFKAAQRVHFVSDDVDHTHGLISAGYNSAVSIASDKYSRFLEKSRLPEAVANQLYLKAKDALTHSSHAALGAIDAHSDTFSKMNVGNSQPNIHDHLKEIPGFADLFGSQDYCSCSECQSIIGAPAYFVDLMSFIEHNVLDEVFKGKKRHDQLYLRIRRPDLWSLPLTCDNTNTLIPYLDVINYVLENYIATRRGFSGKLTDRREVEKAVYQDAIANAHSSFHQPFDLALHKLDVYLKHFSITRLQIAQTLSAPNLVAVRAALKISSKIYEILVHPKADLHHLKALYGAGLSDRRSHQASQETNEAASIAVPDMLAATRYTHSELEVVLATRFVTNDGAQKVAIKSEKSSPESVQNDSEHIRGLTLETLDRLYRFTRLLRTLHWMIRELDLVVSELESAGLATGIEDATLSRIAQISALQVRWQLPLDQNCALWSALPTVATDPQQGSLFDRLFNFAPFVLLDGSFPKPTVSFIHSSFRTAGTALPADNTAHRLLAGLQVSDNDLAALIAALAPALGAKMNTPNESDRGFLLTVQNLGLLYRHALTARLLSLRISDLFQLIQLAGISDGYIATLDDLNALLAFYDWYQGSGYALDDLGVITGGPVQRPAAYPDKTVTATNLVAGIARDHALDFANTVFAFSPGVTEAQSKQIIDANASFFEVDPTSPTAAFRLTTAFNPTVTMTIPAGIPLAPADAVTALTKYHVSQIIPARLAGALGIDAGIVSALVSISGSDLGADAMVQAVKGGPIDPLTALVGQIIPLKVLFSLSGYDADGINFIAQNPVIFATTNFTALTMINVQKLTVYANAAANLADATPLRTALASFTSAQGFKNTDPAALSTALGIDPRVLATLLPSLTLPQTAPEAFTALSAMAALAASLGVGGDTLAIILSDDYTQESRANQAILSAFRARYPVPDDFLKQLKPLDDRIRSAKREALTDYILRSMDLGFTSLDDLYAYFLLDVQLEGCAETSHVVAAMSSAQLYVYRCLMNLEQDQRPPSDPEHIHVSPQLIPADEWEWRQNYRVWQANRKVFLFTETYIEEELRDDKTPLFEDFETSLLQQPINEQNVLDAYSAYLSGFDQISKLQIAGSYQDIDAGAQTDQLHIFGVTGDDPPQFFYRTIENAIYGERDPHKSTIYGPWQPVSVQIPVREVSPVMYLGRLFIFWTEVKTGTTNEVKDGNSKFSGYKHTLILKYTSLRLDGNWTPPQTISLKEPWLFPVGDGIVIDPLGNPLPWMKDLTKHHSVAHGSGNIFDDLKRGKQEATDLNSLETEISHTPRYDITVHHDAKDGYTLEGFQWERVYPRPASDLILTGHNFSMRATVDFYNKKINELGPIAHPSPIPSVLCAKTSGGRLELYTGMQRMFHLEDYPWCTVIADERRMERLTETFETLPLVPLMQEGLYQRKLGLLDLAADIAIINNSPGDAVVDMAGDLLLLQGSVRPQSHLLRRLSTTLGEHLSRTLFAGGVEQLLDIDTQITSGEQHPSFHVEGGIDNAVVAGKIDFKGALGTYFREIFFHAPFLIANQLNSQQNFAAAQSWYHYIFNPTVDDAEPRKGTSPAEIQRMERDRVWRYLEFRGLDAPKLRSILTDSAAIEVYKKDPFNPHAIARLRLSAYQKCIVMKYIDNLIDWGDSLFTEFTMESVNEATLLYVTALEILGPRPEEIGSCGQANEETRTYANIAPLLAKGSEFLAEMETYTSVKSGVVRLIPKTTPAYVYTLPHSQIAHYVNEAIASQRQAARNAAAQSHLTAAKAAGHTATHAHPVAAAGGHHAVSAVRQSASSSHGMVARPAQAASLAHAFAWKRTYASPKAGKMLGARKNSTASKAPMGTYSGFPHHIVKQVSPVFCVPPNEDFLAYWDRVEGQLYKIRHCLDITGTPRQLALFAPPIDPRLLVEAAAAGLSLDDVLNSISGDLPPYRFTYLIEKAKQHTGQLVSFGSTLLIHLEKRDGEKLNMMRLTQQKNILTMTTKMRQFDIDMANNAIDALTAQQATVQFRHDYYQNLVSSGLSDWEHVQADSRNTASGINTAAGVLAILAAAFHLVPQLGSPFAMKYGGVELGHSAHNFAVSMMALSDVAEAISAASGLQAGFDRRSDGWKNQVDMASKELAEIDKRMLGLNIRLQSSQRAMDIHLKTIDQTNDVYNFCLNRFSNLALYTWLSTTMQRLYRDAYTCAYAMAKLAEQAYRFERNDTTTKLLSDSYWNAQHAGLLAGESLLADLDDMERRFIETNYRRLEVDQSFSLSQIDPAALVALRETGSCSFSINELFFDLFYPGQYCRQIKAVRLTIPCVTGPFTNVSATLTLTGSKLRLNPKLGAANLSDVPLQRTVAIATSTAQSDSGVFEFSFRDERYMPFEGAGAISSWTLELPQAFRQFEYHSITDPVVQISYVADQNAALRADVEKQNASLEGAILNALKNQPLGRLFSLRQEFSTTLNRLIHGPLNTPVKLTISDKFLPIFIRSRNIRVTKAELLLRTAPNLSVKKLNIAIDGTNETSFLADAAMGNLLSCDLSIVFAAGLTGDHTIAIVDAGDLAPQNPAPGDLSPIDDSKLLDLMIYVEYQLA